MVTLGQSVGVRNGRDMMPNQQGDINKVTGLLDRIAGSDGGTADTPGVWSTDRPSLIAEVTAAIVGFQAANNRPVIDGVVDPGGGSLRLMNQLAGPAPVSATVTRADVSSQGWVVADPSSLDGSGALAPITIAPSLTRRLVRVEGTSISWFGVVVPTDENGGAMGGSPHLFFTPSPWQGGFQDPGYDDFSSWVPLWDKYTSIIGSQIAASGAGHILVIPFYKNSQSGSLGDFLGNWREVIAAVVGAAINSVDPYFLRDQFTYDSIYTSSFSNGIQTQQNFVTNGAGADSMRQVSFDLDGQAAGSLWHPGRGISYSNTAIPSGVNPAGTRWFVGGRFGRIRPSYNSPSGDHGLCPFLLLHGLRFFG